MSEFTEKLNSSELVSKAWDEIDRDQACAGLLIDTIINEFKDWQPPKEPVEVPQFVADWIKLIKKRNRNVLTLLDSDDMPNDVYDWLFIKEDDENINLILLSWLDGDTPDKPKEKLYFVKLPGVPAFDSYMCKSCSPGEIGYHKKYSSKKPNEIHFSSRYDKKYFGGWQRQFTESEIKVIDERYLTFAVPVERYSRESGGIND